MFRLIATWKMSLRGMEKAAEAMREGLPVSEAVPLVIRDVEDDPAFCSVGYGGLPALDGHVYTDSAFMDGDTLRYGCTMGAEHIANPIDAARLLCGRETNCVLCGRGAEEFAVRAGLKRRDMRTEASQKRWRDAVHQLAEQKPLEAYRGHDTVCVCGLGSEGKLVCGTSTSGLFMKEPGRVGDSPIIGSGFYSDSLRGAAAATGLGEDIMRGCLSYEIVRRMGEGQSAQAAAEGALQDLVKRKLNLGEDAGSISVIALSAAGEIGAATTLPRFPFTAADEMGAKLYCAQNTGDGIRIREADIAQITED